MKPNSRCISLKSKWKVNSLKFINNSNNLYLNEFLFTQTFYIKNDDENFLQFFILLLILQ